MAEAERVLGAVAIGDVDQRRDVADDLAVLVVERRRIDAAIEPRAVPPLATHFEDRARCGPALLRSSRAETLRAPRAERRAGAARSRLLLSIRASPLLPCSRRAARSRSIEAEDRGEDRVDDGTQDSTRSLELAVLRFCSPTSTIRPRKRGVPFGPVTTRAMSRTQTVRPSAASLRYSMSSFRPVGYGVQT